MKQVWMKPQLIVLVRGKPEESVLGTCKNTATVGPQQGSNTHCEHVNCSATLPS